jgi:uncharacterized protein (DUF952 family)/ribosomal protein S18 acetylase RimI-like enzyme
MSMSLSCTTIRKPTPADASGIARVHVETWRSTYQGIVPDDYLAGLSLAAREEFWDKLLRMQAPLEHVFVAEDDAGRIVGMISGGRNRSELPYDGEVKAIYVLKECQGQAIGRRLFQASLDRLAQDGLRSFMLWVLEHNPACGFYIHLGGKLVGEADEIIGGKKLKELAFAWDDLQPLTTARRIYHITDQSSWRKAQKQGFYEHPSLHLEGFVHCSERSQLSGVANRYFQKQRDLLILALDAGRLKAPLLCENTKGGTELFPHVYGPINLDAVLLVHNLQANEADGSFTFSDDLRL